MLNKKNMPVSQPLKQQAFDLGLTKEDVKNFGRLITNDAWEQAIASVQPGQPPPDETTDESDDDESTPTATAFGPKSAQQAFVTPVQTVEELEHAHNEVKQRLKKKGAMTPEGIVTNVIEAGVEAKRNPKTPPPNEDTYQQHVNDIVRNEVKEIARANPQSSIPNIADKMDQHVMWQGLPGNQKLLQDTSVLSADVQGITTNFSPERPSFPEKVDSASPRELSL